MAPITLALQPRTDGVFHAILEAGVMYAVEVGSLEGEVEVHSGGILDTSKAEVHRIEVSILPRRGTSSLDQPNRPQ
jgi:hypothetical protein